jgi:electron transport complex protein RnfC
VRACPANLQVHMIGRCVQFGQVAEAVDYHPEACFDCGLCTFVCPARRPLVQLVNMAKSHIRSAS